MSVRFLVWLAVLWLSAGFLGVVAIYSVVGPEASYEMA